MIITMFHIASALLGLVVAGLLSWKLLAFPDQFHFVERFGMGLVGGTMILRIAPVLSSPDQTPFSDWATAIMSLGLVLMHGGRLRRLIRHAARNQRAVDAAKAHLAARVTR